MVMARSVRSSRSKCAGWESGITSYCWDAGKTCPRFSLVAIYLFWLPSLKVYPILSSRPRPQVSPIVATLVGGIPEIIEDGATGLLIPPKNPQALAIAS